MRIARRRSSGQAAPRHPVLAWGLAVAVLGLAVVPASADRVALRNGTTLDGAVVVDAKTRTIVVTSTRGGMQVKDKVPFASALAVETPTGSSPGGLEQDLVEASGVLWVAAERVRYLEWCDAALKAGDGPRASRFLDAAEKRGATGYIVQQRRQKAAVVKPPAAQSAAAEAAAKAAKAVDAEEAALPKAQAALLWSRLEGSWAGLPEARRIELGERILALDPAHGPVKAWFVSLVPEGYRARFGWKEGARGSVCWAHPAPCATRRPSTPRPWADADGEGAARAASIWKKDVVGVVRDGLVLIARPPAARLVRAATTSAAVFASRPSSHADPQAQGLGAGHCLGPQRSERPLVAPLSRGGGVGRPAHAPRERKAPRAIGVLLAERGAHEDLLARRAGLGGAGGRDPAGSRLLHHLPLALRPLPAVPVAGHRHLGEGAGLLHREQPRRRGLRGRGGPGHGRLDAPHPHGNRLRELQGAQRTGQALRGRACSTLRGRSHEAPEGATKQGEAGLQRAVAWFVQAELAAHWFLYGADAGVRGAFADQVTEYFLGRAEGRTVKAVYGLDAAELGRRIDAWATRDRPGRNGGRGVAARSDSGPRRARVVVRGPASTGPSRGRNA
jgi:hypothetical protein